MSKLKFSDIAIITMGQSPKGESCNNENIGEPLLNGPTEFTDFYPKATQYTTNGKKYSKVGDILFCVRGSTTGRMNISDKEYVLGRGLASIRHKDDKKLNIFLKYLIETNLSNILKNTSGSTFPNLSSEILNSFEFSFPKDMNIEGINSLLKSIDSKIELNNKINKELETMAKTLYNYWFVQFDFPDENGKPYKSSGGKMVYSQELKREIPDGWEVEKLNRFLDIDTGYSFQSSSYLKDGKYKIITIKNVKQGMLNTYNADYINDIPERIKTTSILKLGDVLISLTGDVARVCFVNEENTLLNQRVGHIFSIDDEISNSLIYFIMKSDHIYNKAVDIATGSNQKNLSGIDLLNLKIPFSRKLIISFLNKVQPSFEKMLNIQKQNQELAKLRDWLLPMLMNGQVSVK